MQIYLVKYNNNLSWPDNEVSIKEIFASRESAQKYIDGSQASLNLLTEEEFDKTEELSGKMSYRECISYETALYYEHLAGEYTIEERTLHP